MHSALTSLFWAAVTGVASTRSGAALSAGCKYAPRTLAVDAVAATGSAAPLGSHAAEIYAKFAAEHGALDFSAVIDVLRSG